MAAARTLGMIRVNCSSGDGCDSIIDETRFIQRVGMNGDLDVVLIGDAQARIDGRGRGAPVLMQLQAAGSSENLFGQRIAPRRIALAKKSEIHGPGFGRAKHLFQVPTARGAGGGVGTGCGTRSATKHGGGAVR